MRSLQSIFFWFGGVLVQPLSELTLQEIHSQPARLIKPQTRLELRGLADELAIGQIDGRMYCQEVIQRSQSDLDGENLQTRIIRNCALQPDIFEPIDRLPSRCNKWLIVDYPQDWFYPIADRLDIVSRFSEENIFFTASSGLTRLAPDIFYHIVQRSRLPMEACMVVDAVTPRAVQAIRHGLTSTIFVSSWRLTRDFKLRQLIS